MLSAFLLAIDLNVVDIKLDTLQCNAHAYIVTDDID